jgi:hypothetical protein
MLRKQHIKKLKKGKEKKWKMVRNIQIHIN